MSELKWRVTMLGPSRVGKTSLITAIQVAAVEFFSGTPISVEPVDAVTARAFRRNADKMISELTSRRFSPDSLKGTVEEHEYGVRVDPGIGDTSEALVLAFTDYPGGWISDPVHEGRVIELLADSPVVIVPIDSTLIMESTPLDAGDVVRVLEIAAVTDHVRKWAKMRASAEDPTTLILAPIKCESYFSDNGGRSDRAADLFERVVNLYGGVVAAYREEAGRDAPLLFSPVDTIGPIAVMDVEWRTDAAGGRQMIPTYRVLTDSRGRPRPRSVRGAQPILSHLVRGLVVLQDEALHQQIQDGKDQVKRLQHESKKRSKWWRSWYDKVSGARAKRDTRTRDEKKKIETLHEKLKELSDNVVKATSGAEWSRVREW